MSFLMCRARMLQSVNKLNESTRAWSSLKKILVEVSIHVLFSFLLFFNCYIHECFYKLIVALSILKMKTKSQYRSICIHIIFESVSAFSVFVIDPNKAIT